MNYDKEFIYDLVWNTYGQKPKIIQPIFMAGDYQDIKKKMDESNSVFLGDLTTYMRFSHLSSTNVVQTAPPGNVVQKSVSIYTNQQLVHYFTNQLYNLTTAFLYTPCDLKNLLFDDLIVEDSDPDSLYTFHFLGYQCNL
ncbi:hypothetical protein QWY31_00505 [Cytophagales bacterium LB-30]|uniref:Uncharacterized protein n=1 Tax=Shiella aurantiaca TaxID=3058365 RepID=A0ABT8F1Q2_9BACT|nr:hypothetical protein [Shiella aurantiaca]MDN4163956.1 hypothetical protein [Shiella aurantiaca]